MWELFKNIVFKAYVIALMGFAVWYGYFMYPLIFGFEGKEEAVVSLMQLGGGGTEEEQLFLKLLVKPPEVTTVDLGDRVIEQPYIRGRFHHIGFEIEPDNRSVCVRCHGTVPHDQSKEVRSFLNMHAFYLACETCHMRPQKGEPAPAFRWYDKSTGKLAPNPTRLVGIDSVYDATDSSESKYVTYGNYGAKIAPGKIVDGEFEFLLGKEMAEYVDQYLLERESLSADQQSQAEKVIHDGVNEEPIECEACHNDTAQYIPFADLGYPPRRLEELTTTAAVVGMIKKYREFWIPSILTPSHRRE